VSRRLLRAPSRIDYAISDITSQEAGQHPRPMTSKQSYRAISELSEHPRRLRGHRC